MASVVSLLIEEVTAHAQSDTVSRMRERYAQTVLTFRITYVQVSCIKNENLFDSRFLTRQNFSLVKLSVRFIPLFRS